MDESETLKLEAVTQALQHRPGLVMAFINSIPPEDLDRNTMRIYAEATAKNDFEDKSIETYNRGIMLGYVEFNYYLAASYFSKYKRMQDTQLALEYAKKYEESKDTLCIGANYLLLGRIYESKQDYKEAERYYKLSANYGNKEANICLGDLAMINNKYDLAFDYYYNADNAEGYAKAVKLVFIFSKDPEKYEGVKELTFVLSGRIDMLVAFLICCYKTGENIEQYIPDLKELYESDNLGKDFLKDVSYAIEELGTTSLTQEEKDGLVIRMEEAFGIKKVLN